jgi:ABC-type dipeptide/oligopeptide/nickel transport system ATPase subunit
MKRSTTPALNLELSPNPAPFPYRDWATAKDEFETALRRSTFYGLVTGASGTGKTSLCHALTATEGDARGQILYLSASRVSLLSVVRYFAQVLHERERAF